eukprot:scaffold137023_cov21-Tisochrysis_lutea.AAC.2
MTCSWGPPRQARGVDVGGNDGGAGCAGTPHHAAHHVQLDQKRKQQYESFSMTLLAGVQC